MNDSQQRRAAALQIATQFLGPLPKGSDFDDESIYQDYILLAGKFEQYILHGSFHPEPHKGGSSHGEAKTMGL